MVVKYCRNGVVCKFNLEDLLVHLGGCILNPIFLFVSVFISKIAQKQVKNRFQSNWEENIRPPPPPPVGGTVGKLGVFERYGHLSDREELMKDANELRYGNCRSKS